VRELLEQGVGTKEIARRLGLHASTVSYHKARLGFSMVESSAARYDWPAIQEFYEEGHSILECIERFGFSRWAWAYAVKRGAITPRPHAMPFDQLLAADTPRNRTHIKLRLLAAGLKDNQCEECGISRWRDRTLSLALHHINGDGDDNRLENLRLLCPNCHSQTPNYGAKKYGRKAA
jgi:5-methylcytosine-specific restriction endonuclease McrA